MLLIAINRCCHRKCRFGRSPTGTPDRFRHVEDKHFSHSFLAVPFSRSLDSIQETRTMVVGWSTVRSLLAIRICDDDLGMCS